MPSGDQRGFESGPSCATADGDGAGGRQHDRDVGGAAVGRIARGAMIERDLPAVRRPVEAADHEIAFGQLLGRLRGDVEQMEMRVALILIFDPDVAASLLALLDRVRRSGPAS